MSYHSTSHHSSRTSAGTSNRTRRTPGTQEMHHFPPLPDFGVCAYCGELLEARRLGEGAMRNHWESPSCEPRAGELYKDALDCRGRLPQHLSSMPLVQACYVDQLGNDVRKVVRLPVVEDQGRVARVAAHALSPITRAFGKEKEIRYEMLKVPVLNIRFLDSSPCLELGEVDSGRDGRLRHQAQEVHRLRRGSGKQALATWDQEVPETRSGTAYPGSSSSPPSPFPVDLRGMYPVMDPGYSLMVNSRSVRQQPQQPQQPAMYPAEYMYHSRRR